DVALGGLAHARRVLAKPDRDLGQERVVSPEALVVDRARGPAGEQPRWRPSAITRRVEAARPEIGEGRVGLVGFRLLAAIGFRGARLVLGVVRDGVGALGLRELRAVL